MKVKAEKIEEFLKENNIDYRDSGPDVAKDNVNVKCPYCDNDLMQHMGINLKTGMYGCWRNIHHRGSDVSYLFRKITNVSLLEIRRQIGVKIALETDDVKNMLFALNEDSEINISKIKVIGGKDNLSLDKSFRVLWNGRYEQDLTPYNKYLKARGFDDIERLAIDYRLHFCMYGYWQHRIIFPIYFKARLVTWISRSIRDDVDRPYLDLSVLESVRHANFCLFDYDYIAEGGRNLYVTEGVFDALKIAWYCNKKDKATCLFTNSMTDEQKDLLIRVGSRYDNVFITLDPDALSNALEIQSRLYPLKAKIKTVISDYKDPGAVPRSQIKRWLNEKTEAIYAI
jgi:hypothetical protein